MAEQEVTSFDELIALLRGMCGHTVEANIFMPWDDEGFSVAGFSGTLGAVESRDASPRWVLSWIEDETMPQDRQAALWQRRFVRAVLSFTGEAEDGVEDVDGGQCIFLKVYSEGWILDLIGYM